jgi:hypothetical protein
MAIGDTYLESDGKAVLVTVSSTVAKDQLAYVQSWLGIAGDDATSGDTIALSVDQREYQIQVPTALAVVKGEYIWIDVTDLTGHIPDSTAYYKATGSNRVRFFKATQDQDANDIVTGIMLVP